MSDERFIVLVGAGPASLLDDHIFRSPTADVYIGPPPMELVLKRENIVPELTIKPLREPKKRDWEQRQRKGRRR